MARIILGTLAEGFPLFPGHLALSGKEADTHMHCLGVAGTGKSKILESIALQRIRQGQAISILDPHSDLVNATLANLMSMNFFKQKDAFKKLLFVEFHDGDSYLPFNFLKQPHSTEDTIADDTLEAFHRAWPELTYGAAQFDTMVINGVRVLLANDLPLPALYPLILDKEYRHKLLQKVDNYGVKAYFENFERLRSSEQADQSASTIRRINLLTSSPAIEYALGQADCVLPVRQLMDEGVSVLYDLGKIRNTQARRLMGALLMVMYERAALSRLGTNSARMVHHLIVDEFSQFSAQSSHSLAVMLSETRKANLFACLAHQTWGQLENRMHGALQNVGVKICLRIGRQDAEVMAKWMGQTDPMRVKFEPLRDTQFPQTFGLGEQWEAWINSLVQLPDRQALVKVFDKASVEIRTTTVPDPNVTPQDIEQIKAVYRKMLRHKSTIKLPYELPAEEEFLFSTKPRS